ncbi:MAG: OmpA family protein [Bacteroidota bacterium]
MFLEADFYFQVDDNQKALDIFEDLLVVDPDNNNLNFLCGLCCTKIPNANTKAINYLEEAVLDVDPSYNWGSYKETQAPEKAYFLLAKSYHLSARFEEAIHFYEIYRDSTAHKKFSETEYVNNQIKSCELASSMVAKPLKVKFGNLLEKDGGNYSRSRPLLSGNDSLMIYLEFDSNNAMMINMTTRNGDGWSRSRVINLELGVTSDYSPSALSSDGTELYLVRRDYYNSDIYVSHYRNKRWTKVLPLNSNINSKYNETHASVSVEGNTLYFTSDRKGGYGGTDIYWSRLKPDGEWNEAVNLGPVINTIYNEETPFLTGNDTKLYFSSEGHRTMGGYDIFHSRKNENGLWSDPENLGYPVNTVGDDVFYNPGWKDECGYYTWTVTGQLKSDIKTIQILPETVQLADRTPVKTGEKANEIHIRPGIKEDPPEADNQMIESTPETNVIATSFKEYQILNSILFDYNEYRLNEAAKQEVERICAMMKDLPETTIELTGHTDSRGSPEYNLSLSRKRAQSVASLLLNMGIEEDRISIVAQGESSPIAINKYEDGSDAPNGRMLNRFTSIKIHNLPEDRVRVAGILVPDALRPVQDLSYVVLLTENDQIINEMPKEFFGSQIALVKAERTNLYVSGTFNRKTEAIDFLNNAIDYGFPEARIMETAELKNYIRGRSDGVLEDMNAFTIQIMALKKPRDVSYFKALGPVMKYTGTDGFNRYTYGLYKSREEAMYELSSIKAKGYRDSFVISLEMADNTDNLSGSPTIIIQNEKK